MPVDDRRSADLVLTEDLDAVRLLTLNRPDRFNAFTAEGYRHFHDKLLSAETDPDIRVVLVVGAGRGFCSGVDLDALPADAGGRADLAASFDGLVGCLSGFSKPLIAAVHGPAVGFGATMLLHFDMVLVAEDARLRMPFTSLGTSPEAASSVLLPALVGPQRAADLILTSRWVSGEEAYRIGLAARCCAAADLLDEALGVARMIAAHSPAAVASAKRLLRWGGPREVDETSARERHEANLLVAELGSLQKPTAKPDR